MSKSVKGNIMRDPVRDDAADVSRSVPYGSDRSGRCRTSACRLAGAAPGSTGGQPGLNILVIIVDEMRSPSAYLPQAIRETQLPNITKLANEGVDFTNHHIASTVCVASRATMMTGLYSHQTAMFGTSTGRTKQSFPTYRTMLRDAVWTSVSASGIFFRQGWVSTGSV
jgi:hypothetical protein